MIYLLLIIILGSYIKLFKLCPHTYKDSDEIYKKEFVPLINKFYKQIDSLCLQKLIELILQSYSGRQLEIVREDLLCLPNNQELIKNPDQLK